MDSQDITGTQVLDSSGNGRHAAIHGDPQPSQGRLWGAMHFDGVDDYLDTGYTGQLDNWTVSVWVMGDADPTNIWDAGPVMKQENFLISWDHRAASFREAAGLSVGGTWHPASFGTLSGGSWIQLSATYDGETLRAYRDGVLITENTAPSGSPDTAADSMKIARHSVNDFFFAGRVDEVRVYNHSLTAQEIALLADPHRADTSGDGCVDSLELDSFIDHWYLDSSEYPMGELMEAVGLWKSGAGC
jgi:hypothetical protein